VQRTFSISESNSLEKLIQGPNLEDDKKSPLFEKFVKCDF
jgi:hypothetical protein